MPYTPILATLGYVLSRDKTQVLLIHRTARAGDLARGKYNGLGGKMEASEDALACLRRELREEADIDAQTCVLRGTVSWPGFGKHGEDWFGFIYLVTDWSGDVPAENAEGTLHWVPVETLLSFSLPLWPGDTFFLPLVFDDDLRPFHGVMPYENGQPVRWEFSR